MKLTTAVDVTPWSQQLVHGRPISLMGSCFTEYMGERLQHAGFVTHVNPGGIAFNPASIADTLGAILDEQRIDLGEWVERDGLYHHFDLHSRFSGLEPIVCTAEANAARKSFRVGLMQSQALFITLGTAWVYRLAQGGSVVSNCHAFPAKQFSKELLDVAEVARSLSLVFAKLRSLRSDLPIIITLSPVRHWRDGALANTLSKSILRLAIESLVQEYSQLTYFPSFEIMMDELRDYRYYADDMLHPSTIAQEIIWKRLTEAACSIHTRGIVDEVEQYRQMCAHRSRFPGSEGDERFQKQLHKRKAILQDKYPDVSL